MGGKSAVSAEDQYTLFRPDLLTQLLNRNWFRECVDFHYHLIGRKWRCVPVCSARRLGEAHTFWLEDAKRTLFEGIEEPTQELDHFKQASFIAFWLRRTNPINETQKITSLGERQGLSATENQTTFMRYGNEICAFSIGAQMCRYYETEWLSGDLPEPFELFTSDPIEYFRNYTIDLRYLKEVAMIMKHKNMSPHALYLLYRALLSQAKFRNVSTSSGTNGEFPTPEV